MKQDAVDVMVAQWARREPGLDVSALEVVGRLFRAAELGQQAVLAAVRPLGLSYGDFDVLNTLRRRNDEGGTNPRDLARSALITSGAMTARLDRLQQAGLVERELDGSDRRQILIRLTDRGEQVAKEALDAVLAADAEFLAPLSERQRHTLATTLKHLLPPVED